MSVPVQITFHNIPHSSALEKTVRNKAKKLANIYDAITGLRVVLATPHKHHHKGVLYQVNIDVSVPGKDIVVKRCPDKRSANQDAYVAVRNAFSATQKRLRSYYEKRRP